MTNDKIKYKTGLRRLGAAIVDGLVFMPLFFVDNSIRGNLDSEIGLFLWLTFYTVLTFFYTVFMHFKFGQTLGKMATNIKVVNHDETRNITLRQAFLRDSFFIVVETLGLLYFAVELIRLNLSKTELLNGFDDFVGTVATIWVLLELLSMLTNEKRRAIHDFIASTVVIKTDIKVG
jgi:uncharacterized RDD family membrane protein YckC